MKIYEKNKNKNLLKKKDLDLHFQIYIMARS